MRTYIPSRKLTNSAVVGYFKDRISAEGMVTFRTSLFLHISRLHQYSLLGFFRCVKSFFCLQKNDGEKNGKRNYIKRSAHCRMSTLSRCV